MENPWLSPPISLGIFLLLTYGLYRLGGVWAARGAPHPDKHRLYTGGEDMVPPSRQMSYHAFFRLALLFALLHVAALVLSTLPANMIGSHRLAVLYILGIGVSMLVLIKQKL
jgi:NADH:ubiquinone oxidoreductase subunit 3 (subunit A)